MTRRNVIILLLLCLIGVGLGFSLFRTETVFSPEDDGAEEELVIESTHVSILFVGDMMFDRYIRRKANENGYDAIFQNVREMLLEADLVVGNLEGPVTSYASVSPERNTGPEHFQFTFDPAVASLLYRHNIRAVSLANNHMFDFGREGIAQTRQYLEESNVGFFGDPQMQEHYFLDMNVEGISFRFIGYSEWTHTVEEIIPLIRDSHSDFTIVVPHWGDEYVLTPNQKQVDLAHTFIDAGADLVIGAHPHVIQTVEEYNGKKIFYSLGNFVFDQYFSNDVRCGLVVEATFSNPSKKITFREMNTFLERDGTTSLGCSSTTSF
jgi:gamma-polyglutamate biosynthesis protein CapA